MIVGAAVVELHIHGSQSLKARRGVVRAISQRVRNRMNLSVAEVGGQDTWQRAVLGLAAAGSDAVNVRRQLERAVEFIEGLGLAEVLGSDIDVETRHYFEAGALWDDDDGANGLREDDPEDADDGPGLRALGSSDRTREDDER